MSSHFLHIGKTGGTALRHALVPLAAEYDLQFHYHEVRFGFIPKGEKVFFFVRDPITRFVSSFYSRKRCGRPRFDSPWDAFETHAFGIFDTPNRLAEDLSSPEQSRRDEAMNAMYGIRHINQTYKSWFYGFEEIERRVDDILLIGIQEELQADFERLKILLSLPKELALPSDPVNAHRRPLEMDATLTELAVENLNTWFADDIAFYGKCLEFRNARLLNSV